jgi:hypothetical protein
MMHEKIKFDISDQVHLNLKMCEAEVLCARDLRAGDTCRHCKIVGEGAMRAKKMGLIG